jgi:hypothetical protein
VVVESAFFVIYIYTGDYCIVVPIDQLKTHIEYAVSLVSLVAYLRLAVIMSYGSNSSIILHFYDSSFTSFLGVHPTDFVLYEFIIDRRVSQHRPPTI